MGENQKYHFQFYNFTGKLKGITICAVLKLELLIQKKGDRQECRLVIWNRRKKNITRDRFKVDETA